MDPAALGATSLTSYDRAAFRQQAPEFDPLSGEGARRRGGRFNPPDSFPVLYLCSTRACAVAEFRRAGARLAIGPEGLLPRHLFRYSMRLDRVLDLREDETTAILKVSREDLVGHDVSTTRQIGEAAHALGLQAVLAPSATGQDDVLAVFIENIGSGLIEGHPLEVWNSLADVEGSR